MTAMKLQVTPVAFAVTQREILMRLSEGSVWGAGNISFGERKFEKKQRLSRKLCCAGQVGEKGRERHLKRGRGGEERDDGMLVHAAAWQQDAARMPASPLRDGGGAREIERRGGKAHAMSWRERLVRA
jgi:hypothetical protein